MAQDYAEAMKWYRRAVEQGYALAQNNLGGIYANGLGVRQNNVQAYMWATLAASQNVELGVKGKDFLVKKMPPPKSPKPNGWPGSGSRRGSEKKR